MHVCMYESNSHYEREQIYERVWKEEREKGNDIILL